MQNFNLDKLYFTKFYKISLSFFLLGLGFVNQSLALSLPYQYVIDFNEDNLLIQVKDLDKEKKYYLCNLAIKNCSFYTIKPSISSNSSFGFFPSPDKTYFLWQTYNKKIKKFITFFVAPNVLKPLPLTTKISSVKWQEDNFQKIAIVSGKNIFIFNSLNDSFQKIPLLDKISSVKISPSLKYISYFTPNGSLTIQDLDNNIYQKIELGDLKPIEFLDFIKDEYLLFIKTDNGFNNFILYHIPTGKRDIIFNDDFIIDSFLIDKNKIYFIANKDNYLKWNLYQFDFNDKSLKIILENVAYDFNLIKLKNFLIAKKLGELPPEIVLINLDNIQIEKLDLKISAKPIKIGEILKIDETYGVIVKPDNFTTDQEYNLIVWLHGGPMRQTSIGYHPYFSYGIFDLILEELRKNNRIIAKIDYVGSWGYGLDYQNRLKNNIGKLDVESVIKFVNYLKNSLRIKNIYLMGNSYGGYLSLKLLYEYPEIFTASISINGVSDWWSLIKNIPSSPFRRYFNSNPYFHKKNLYDQASVYLEPQRLKDKKILLIYGENDETVPIYQSKLFNFRYKKIAKITTKSYNDEGHILLSKENIEDILKSIENFLISD